MKIAQHYSQCTNCQTLNRFKNTEEIKKCKGCGVDITLPPKVKNILIKERERLEAA